MNILPVALGLLAWQMLNGKNKKPFGKAENADGGFGAEMFKNGLLDGLLANPEALSSLASVTKLFDKKASQKEKSTAIFGLLSNPAVFEFAKTFFTAKTDSGEGFNEKAKSENAETNADEAAGNEEAQYSPSEQAQEAFKPVTAVAGVEVTDKLCRLYDNWYIKNN